MRSWARRSITSCDSISHTKHDDSKISSKLFYEEYHGHRVEHLTKLLKHLRSPQNVSSGNHPQRNTIFLAGDSSLDNKYWFSEEDSAVNGYQDILSPPVCKQDIAYWMNHYLSKHDNDINFAVINCAVEESTVRERDNDNLTPQDLFVRDNIQRDDILIVSVGANFTPRSWIANSFGLTLTLNNIVGAWLSNLFTFPFGFGYFSHLFKSKVEAYLDNLTIKTRPKFIFVCMIYYLGEKSEGAGWADGVLKKLRYDSHPDIVQTIISRLFVCATERIALEGTTIIPIPLFKVLDGKNPTDYVARVEPSAHGGKKMGKYLVDEVEKRHHKSV